MSLLKGKAPGAGPSSLAAICRGWGSRLVKIPIQLSEQLSVAHGSNCKGPNCGKGEVFSITVTLPATKGETDFPGAIAAIAVAAEQMMSSAGMM